MMRLMLLRHAKADGDIGEGDHARRLSARGIHEAAELGTYLAEQHLMPDLILASDSTRTAMSMNGLLAQWSHPAAVRLIGSLYNAGALRLLSEIHRQAADVRCLMLIAHNPGIAELALRLTGSGDRYALARMRQKFPPCALAVLDFACESWSNVNFGDGRLERHLTPRAHDAAP